jgi:hypothetical protein
MTAATFQVHDNEMNGYCTECEEVTNFGGCEPDAREYECDQCGNRTVYGVAEALIMGVLIITEDDEDEDESDGEDDDMNGPRDLDV